MINVCHHCGVYRPDKEVDPTLSIAICPVCCHPYHFQPVPLLLVCGASGAGKSAICAQLARSLTQVVSLDADFLWRAESNRPDDGYRDIFETWLRLGKNIGQSGRPQLLFGAGFIPKNVEKCVERR